MDTTTDWRPRFVASAALMLRVKAKKKWPGWSDADQEVAKAACRQAAEDIEGIPALRARAEAAEAELCEAQSRLGGFEEILGAVRDERNEALAREAKAQAAFYSAAAEIDRLRAELARTQGALSRLQAKGGE